MNDPALRVLEHALEEAYAAPQRRDVTWRVLQELKRPGHAPARRPALKIVGIVTAAAAVVAVLLGAWIMDRPRVSKAVASVDVLVFDADGGASSSSNVEPGRVVLVQRATRIELPNGATVEADPGTVLRWSTDPVGLALAAGSLVVDARGNAIVLENATGRLELSRDGRARFGARSSPTNTLPSDFDSARRLAMQPHWTALASVVTATLFTGSGVLVCSGGTHTLEPARPVTVDPTYGQEPEPAASEVRNPFEHEAGSWELEVSIPGAGEAVGSENVRVGPHPLSIISDLTVAIGGRSRDAHVVLMWDPKRAVLSGSFTDSGGGQIGVLRGELREDGAQVVEMFRTDGRPFDLRRISWHVHPDERRTQFQARVEGEWELVQDVAHYRARTTATPALFQVTLAVRDMARQIAFYRDALGFEVSVPREGTEDALARANFVVLETGGAQLALRASAPEEPAAQSTACLSFRVEDLERARKRLEASGVEVGELRHPAAGVSVIELCDPEGNVVQLEHHTASPDGR